MSLNGLYRLYLIFVTSQFCSGIQVVDGFITIIKGWVAHCLLPWLSDLDSLQVGVPLPRAESISGDQGLDFPSINQERTQTQTAHA